MVFNRFETYIIKTYIHFEFMLIQLGLGISIISYSRADIGTEEKNKNVELQIEQVDSLHINKKNLIGSEVGDNLITSITRSTQKYMRYGQRYVLFSNQIKLVKTLISQLKQQPTQVSRTYTVYNIANTKKYSKFKFISDITIHMSSRGITINKLLFLLIYDLFTKKYDQNTQNHDRVHYAALSETLYDQFLNKDELTLYSRYFIDFRGRVYSNSTVSVTSIKLLRYILSNKSTISVRRNRHYKYLLTLIPLIPKSIHEIRKFSTDEFIILLIGFLNLGKLVKSKLLKEHYVTLETFIKTGIEMYILDVKTLCTKYAITDVDDIGYLLTTKKKLYTYIHEGKSFTIILDSTASGIFHLNI